MSFQNAQDALAYIQGGNATVTMTSAATGKHFTFKINQPTLTTEAGGKKRDYDANIFFVSGLHGSPDVFSDWHIVGFFFKDAPYLHQTKKDRIYMVAKTESFKAFSWALGHLAAGNIPASLTIQHEGSCCRCGRTLTHPESIARGIGPECIKHF